MTLMGDGQPCPICTGDSCIGFPDFQHRDTYPFIEGGVAMAQEPHVIATERIDHPDGGPALYGVGDKIPYAHAVELGLTGDDIVAAHQAVLDARDEARARKPTEDRAKKPAEDRAKPKRRTRKKVAE